MSVHQWFDMEQIAMTSSELRTLAQTVKNEILKHQIASEQMDEFLHYVNEELHLKPSGNSNTKLALEQKYLANKGLRCPYCNSSALETWDQCISEHRVVYSRM